MTGTGSADMHGAITIINATATGRGASLGVVGGVEATWTATEDGHLDWQTPGMDDRLVRVVHTMLMERYSVTPGAAVRTASRFPPSRGLKTSSGAAAALIQSGLQAHGQSVARDTLVERAVQASVAAGVTVTGAFDDQVAVVHGGCHLTDNVEGYVMEEVAIEPWHVAIWVPEQAITKQDVAHVDATPASRQVRAAEKALLSGSIPDALTINGKAFMGLYQQAGLPVTDGPVSVAMRHGALGAGLSGTGPAVAALFDEPVELPAVQGGQWEWTEAIG